MEAAIAELTRQLELKRTEAAECGAQVARYDAAIQAVHDKYGKSSTCPEIGLRIWCHSPTDFGSRPARLERHSCQSLLCCRVSRSQAASGQAGGAGDGARFGRTHAA